MLAGQTGNDLRRIGQVAIPAIDMDARALGPPMTPVIERRDMDPGVGQA
jgi:hypothetical protein